MRPLLFATLAVSACNLSPPCQQVAKLACDVGNEQEVEQRFAETEKLEELEAPGQGHNPLPELPAVEGEARVPRLLENEA